MSAVIIEHVKVADLPENWRARLPAEHAQCVTVRLEEEVAVHANPEATAAAVGLLFGMWRDREDMADVEGYLRKLREPRFRSDGSRA
jgi:hypothetical protein